MGDVPLFKRTARISVEILTSADLGPRVRRHTTVILGGRETSSSTTIKVRFDFGLCFYFQCSVKGMLSSRKLALFFSFVHKGKFILHLLSWKHGDVCQSKWLKDVFMEVVVK